MTARFTRANGSAAKGAVENLDALTRFGNEFIEMSLTNSL